MDVYRNSDRFESLRENDELQGKCGACITRTSGRDPGRRTAEHIHLIPTQWEQFPGAENQRPVLYPGLRTVECTHE